MKISKKSSSAGTKKMNDPGKVDPTKQDERDNDATRIRPEKKEKEKEEPSPQPSESQNEPARKRDPQGQSLPANPHKPEINDEPWKQKGAEINKEYNPANPEKKNNEERDDNGHPVLKGFGKGL